MPRNEFMLTSHSHLRHVTDTFYFYCECDLLAGLRQGKGYTSPLKSIHHHDKHRGEVQRGSIRLYHASCRQSGSAETSYSEKHLAELLPGAKIGVLGLNGAGKSTLLRIMAGLDKDIEGEARPQPGIKIGYLPQEPQLNPEHTVRESIEEAVSEVVNALKRLDEVYALYADPDADFDKLAAEQGRLEEIIRAHDGHNLNVQLERAADALRLPDWDAKVEKLSGGERRRVALCRLLLEKPDMLLLDEPTNHRMPNLLRGWNVSCTTSKAPSWRLPTTVTSSITSPAGFWSLTAAKVFRGKATTPPGWSRKISVWRRKRLPKRRAVNPLRKSWSGCVRARKAVSRKVRRVWLALKN